ncbi:serine/threonine protein kinase [Nitzschia inconspicua]|uniref:Serine/threonine protein kinase n=1 Tax=Nitzschia inconspicua TaxID=303405 RepID=A0A9K3M366_9STRA|nr:serine/threonine protein kinase [Nitzschia inconspicua]
MAEQDAMMEEVTSAMGDMQMPEPGGTEGRPNNAQVSPRRHHVLTGNGSASSPLRSIEAKPSRPLDAVIAAGPAAPPIEFPSPKFERGRRDHVLVYVEHTRTHQVAKNVLFRDYSREYGETPEKALSRVKQAYWPMPYKERINTIMGHVEICVVLTRCAMDCSDEDGTSDHSPSDDSSSGEEDDVVFQVTDRHVAVKVNYSRRMERYRGRHAENPLQEIAAMQLIGNEHPHVMGVIEVLFDGSNLNVVMPYAGSGDLFQMLQDSQERGTGFSEPEARYWFRQIMDGVKHLHNKGVCHRDLSPENVMIDSNNSLIIDMGMAIRIPYSDPQHPNRVVDITKGTAKRMIAPQGTCGKLPYMSPEIYRNRTPFDGGAVDVWTCGTILFCMVTGNRSYSRPHDSDAQYYWMTHGLPRLLHDWNIELTSECVHLLKNMLQVDPRLRLTLDEVIHHPWFHHHDAPPVHTISPPPPRRPVSGKK